MEKHQTARPRIVGYTASTFDQIREVMRFPHYSYRTEKTYTQWTRRYLAFHRAANRSGPDGGWRQPRSMGAPEVASFLSQLAMNGNVAASTQNQALNALVFLCEHVLQIQLGDIGQFARVTRPARLPEVLTQEQTRRVLAALKTGTAGLIIRLLYGTGMRVMEAVRAPVSATHVSRFAPRLLPPLPLICGPNYERPCRCCPA